MTTLLIDNYDSYTYNVFHLLAAVSGEEPIVVRNDVVSWRALSRWDFDAIVISPGPGRPERWHDFGVCSDILRSSDIPVLGVCLGHQGLGHLLNGAVRSAPIVMHGRLSGVHHDGSGLFEGIPQGFSVVRYHSLAVADELGPEGRVTAWTDEGVVMGIEHRSRPMWGVQFHPESVATEHGHRLCENFYALARSHRAGRVTRASRPPAPPRRAARAVAAKAGGERLRLRVRSLEGEPSTELLFERLFGEADHAFWLDSVDAPSTLARSSFLGTSAGARRTVIEYDVNEKLVSTHGASGVSTQRESIFEALDRELTASAIEPPEGLPSGLIGGFVGYLGYECKADCGSANVHRSQVPDAVLMLANRVVAVDHVAHRTHLLALGPDGEADAERWLQEAETAARATLEREGGNEPPPWQCAAPDERTPRQVSFRCGRGREQYLADIAHCQAALSAGESYEVCLTDQIHTDARADPFDLYRVLRRRNPAPFAAYLRLGDLTVLSSSPERFLSVDRDRRVQARPIKGTAPRSPDRARDEELRDELLSDEKTFAEHLMIVDLLRNDLGRVCEVDTVRVPQLMVVEPYTTVHQLISTITGVLSRERTPLECVRACFPGGSMTGAPKLRTMSIIDDIEREARGVYSGAIGYFGLDGSVDLSIVIRTIVMAPGDTTIGAGGAIVMQSDPVEEFDELLLKARAPMSAIAQAVTGSDAPQAWTVALASISDDDASPASSPEGEGEPEAVAGAPR
ncbi:MAG TPA: aminodeoxychorismate synthase component I [Solirubrobacteraceae bacterium]|nr:aminodeoxychorismate synthase component I [Solirubrobacteraceae bacterium]